LRRFAVRFHFPGEVTQSVLGLRAMLALLVPAIGPEGEKDADSYQRDLEQEIEERPSMFSAAQAHAREYAPAIVRFKPSG
jgi:hypothetical protein